MKLNVECPACVEYAQKGYSTPPGKVLGAVISGMVGDEPRAGFMVERFESKYEMTLEDCYSCNGVGYTEIDSPACPKCKGQHVHGAPLGKIARNPYSAEKFYDECPACHGLGHVTAAVIAGIMSRYGEKTQEIVSQLNGGGDHYYFHVSGMYVGVEWSEGYEGWCHT